MLTIASLGMLVYGLYSLIEGCIYLFGTGDLEWWASLWLIVAVGTLIPAAIFVRASIPGGLALAISSFLALQSISLHNAGHIYGQVLIFPQLSQASFAILLIIAAHVGWESG